MKFLNFFKKPQKDDLFNSHPDGIFVVESDGRILDVNNRLSSIFEFSCFDMVGQFFSKFIEGGSAVLNKIITTKNPITARAFAKSNKEIYLELTASQNPNSKNVYVCVREVTANYKTQNAAKNELVACRQIVDEKNAYLANITGDVLSHLNSIKGFSKALLDGIGGELVTKQEKYVQIINKNSFELDYDLSKMLQYFKLESDLFEYEPKNFDLINYLNASIKPYEEKFKNKMLNLTYDFSSLASRNCFQDPSVIEDIITSLLEIAHKTMDVGTCIVSAQNPSVEFLQNKGIEVEDENSVKKFVVFEIKDTAPAYLEDDLINIFNPYHISNEIPKRPVGTKFTYAIVKAHLKKIGGKIWVHSKPMQGNLVCVLIPTEMGALSINMENNG